MMMGRQPTNIVWRQKSRWMPLVATSNSGKILFVCLCCGRTSTTPDKRCSAPMTRTNGTSFTCQEWESDPHTVVGPVQPARDDPSVLEAMVDKMAGETQAILSNTRAKIVQQNHDKDTAIELIADLADYLFELPEDEKRNKVLKDLGEALVQLVGEAHAELPPGGWKELLVESRRKRMV